MKNLLNRNIVKTLLSIFLCVVLAFSLFSCSGGDTCSAYKKHQFTQEIPSFEALKESATSSTNAVYYKSCKCGKVDKNGETFELNVSGDKNRYKQNSPTVTMYETDNKLSYGFTWNSLSKPYTSVVGIKKTTDSNFNYYKAQVEEYFTYDEKELEIEFYVSKAVVELEESTNYQYFLADLGSGIKTDNFEFTTVNNGKTAFSFASFSDTQDENGGGNLNKMLKKVSNVDFYLHTGDICEDSKHEKNWTSMLDVNKEYFAKKPLMVTAGNHDTIYKSGYNEVFKHFNNNIPPQLRTGAGYFYSFNYNNALFIMLNTNDVDGNYELPEEQLEYLVETLKNSNKKWKIVSMHCPMYSIGKWGNSMGQASNALREQLTDIFNEYKVDLVIQGHDHLISKTYPIVENNVIEKCEIENIDGVEYSINPKGSIYIMNGPSSRQTRNPDTRYNAELYEYHEASKSCSWAEYNIEDNKLTVSVKYLNLSTNSVNEYYTWGIKKGN